MCAQEYVMGIDFGTESFRVGIFTLTGEPVIFTSEPYPLRHPRPGWAEQNPEDWWQALCKRCSARWRRAACRPQPSPALAPTAPVAPSSPWTRTSSLCARPSFGWTCAPQNQATRIGAERPPGPQVQRLRHVSAEWMPCKALWLKENEPEI